MIRLPQALPNKTAATMWPALCGDGSVGGLWPGLSRAAAKIRAVLVTCDAAPANVKLLGHLSSVLDERTMLLPFLCLQHRTGNVIERLTKLTGSLTGCYAVSKTMRSGAVVKRLTASVRRELRQTLMVTDQVPAGCVEEWASGRVCAEAILRLAFADEEASKMDLVNEFLDFFAGPWTGLPLGWYGACRPGLSFLFVWTRSVSRLKHPVAMIVVTKLQQGEDSKGKRLQLLLRVRTSGLSHAFRANDSRSETARGLWPGSSMDSDEALEEKIAELSKYLVADTYGNVRVVHWAREAHPLHVVLDFSATKPGCTGKLWLGGENASGDAGLLLENGIGVVQPASRKHYPAESLQIKILPWVDGTGLAAGDVSLDQFLQTVDGLIAMMLDGEGVLSCCKNGAHRSATETP
eukprot:s662_g26.t1